MGSERGGMGLSERIREVLAIDPAAQAVEFEGSWHPWRELAAWLEGFDRALAAAGLGQDEAVGILLRNRPAIVGALLAVLATRRCVVSVNPMQGPAKLAEDLCSLRLPAVVAHRDDWAIAQLREAAEEVGSVAIEVAEDPAAPCRALPGLEALRGGPHHDPLPGVAVEMLTSGTTGPPKRVALGYRSLEQSLLGAAHYESGKAEADKPVLKKGVAIVAAPLVHVSGMWRAIQALVDGRRISLLERFTVEGWRDVVRRHRPKVSSLVPTALRMVLDANLPKEDMASLRAVTSATAPLPPETAIAFEEKYGIPVLTLYGATEFAGGVAGWTLGDHQKWAQAKRGSVGRAHPGCELRIVSPEDGGLLAVGETGLLEVRSAQLGAEAGWVRTTDWAELDADGFLWIRGRADNVIIRGGFKIAPAEVAEVLERHPAVHEASVVGIADERLGALPMAAVELEAGVPPVDGEELRSFARQHLAKYQVPARILIVEALPRTSSLKVSEPAVRALFEEPAGG
ncbi:MAG: long-chain fatty acid--CoA ligase [Deltaproteobacteria bacterium]|nr:long-chain fatty acid--CoA ligase [Deltaproteobacteria bacterium]